MTNLSNEEDIGLAYQKCPSSTERVSHSFGIFFITDATLNIFFSLTATSGNILILFTLRKATSMRSSSKLLLCNLAIADLGIGLVVHPLKAACELRYRCQLIPDVYVVYTFAASIFLSVSLLTTLVITIDRLLALSLGIKYRQVVTLKRTLIVTIILWSISVLYGVAFVFNKIVYSVLAFIGVVLCTVAASTSFIAIFIKLHRLKRKVKDHSDEAPQQQKIQYNFNRTQYKSSVHTILFIFVALLVCTLPYMCFTAFARLWRSNDGRIQLTFFLTQTVVFLNSSLNPLLYCWRIQEVRRAMKNILQKYIYCSKPSTVNPDDNQLPDTQQETIV